MAGRPFLRITAVWVKGRVREHVLFYVGPFICDDEAQMESEAFNEVARFMATHDNWDNFDAMAKPVRHLPATGLVLDAADFQAFLSNIPLVARKALRKEKNENAKALATPYVPN